MESADSVRSPTYELSPAARRVDGALAEIDDEIDWLDKLTPRNIDAVWAGFRESDFKSMPALEYAPVALDLEELRDRLMALPVHDIDDPFIETLLIEKQRELDRQIDLVRMRGQDGFVMTSLDLFGGVGDRMLDRAYAVLEQVPDVEEKDSDSTADDFLAAARRELAWYAERADGYDYEARRDSNPGTHVYISRGHLHVADDYKVAANRIEPLIHHEIGTHTLTRHNGHRQPMRTLQCGLADYDTLQEGIAVLAEYLSGYLPPSRLRLLAARVVAAHMAVQEEDGAAIFARLFEEYHLAEESAFSTTVRAKRGGGLTKDALYLKGLIELMAYLGHGGDFEVLFLGKFALKQLPVLEKLLERGLLVAPELLPRYLESSNARERIEQVRSMRISQLFQETPEA